MNKLKGLRFYESGPMDRCTPELSENWRNDISNWLEERNAIALNPVNKPIAYAKEDLETRGEILRLKELGEYDKIRENYGRNIVGVDLRLVDVCDAVVLYVNTDIHMVGSYFEAAIANLQKKPLLVVVEQTKANCPNWLLFLLNHREIFSSFDELKEYLDYIDKGGEPYSKNRWWFFDKDKI